MNLVKQLPIGLGLACLMFMSSCSKEEAVTPGTAVPNESSNLREGGAVLSTFHLPSTDGPTCLGCAPKWGFDKPEKIATSNLIAYGGHPLKKWLQPLAAPSTGSGSIITIVSGALNTGRAYATIENLIKGKKYKLTFSISTNKLSAVSGQSSYANHAVVFVKDHDTDLYVAYENIDFNGKQNQWITKTFEFEAKDNEQSFAVYGNAAQNETNLTYTNLHVGKNAVQQIN